jgi:(1->4)-alpha-D-glucan 1-alpha-D-glucosylmutase
MPEAWAEAVNRWAGLTAPFRRECAGSLSAPEPEVEWMFYQALAGAWPLDLSLDSGQELFAFADRMTEFMLKAVREAKVHTSWTGQNQEYEDAISTFTRAALDPERGGAFLRDFLATCQPIFLAGACNSLTQTALKLTAPGVPDIYQGTEFWDLSLVDPDNRRPVGFDARQSQLDSVAAMPVDEVVAAWRGGLPKLRLLAAGIALRKARKKLFDEGDYLPLTVEGAAAEHVVAFARVLGTEAVVVVAPRLPLRLIEGPDTPLIAPTRWGDAGVLLPRPIADQSLTDIVTGCRVRGERLKLIEIFGHFPLSVLA